MTKENLLKLKEQHRHDVVLNTLIGTIIGEIEREVVDYVVDGVKKKRNINDDENVDHIIKRIEYIQ